MMGKSHVVCNAAACGLLADGCLRLKSLSERPDAFGAMAAKASGVLSGIFLAAPGTPKFAQAGLYLVCAFMFWLGSLLPDIDSPGSILGRRAEALGRLTGHRTIFHAIWIPAAFLAMGRWFLPMSWLALGYILHLFFDSFSACGVCWFWPLSKYRKYPNGAMVKKGHVVKLYHAGEPSEGVAVTIIIILGILFAADAARLVLGHAWA